MELLFRGITCKTHKVVYGNYVKSDCSWSKGHHHRDWIIPNIMTNGGWIALKGRWPVVNGTVEQFTGKLDKNGTRLFGGNIIFSVENEVKFTVTYNYEKCMFVAVRNVGWGINNMVQIPIDAVGEFVVVGNIYEKEEFVKKLEKKAIEEQRVWRELK